MTTESGKPWTVSATLRGFYDDNINTLPDNAQVGHRGSAGFQVNPSLQFSFPMEQTSISFGYDYSLKYYENRPQFNSDNYDQTHQFNAALSHSFSERYQLSVSDSFVIGQEPDMLRSGNTYTTFQRVSGDNLRNYGSIMFSAQLTPELGIETGYGNTYYSYAANIPIFDAFGHVVPGGASLAGLLDELDHLFHLDLRYQIQPQTVGIVGYQFRETDYIGDQPIGFDAFRNRVIVSEDRNARSHYGYVGLDHNFRTDLSGSFRVGARFTDYYNNPASQDDVGPYALASLRYNYLPESFLQFGVSYDYNASSQFSVDNAGNLTLNAQSVSVFGSITHRITPKLFGSITASFQNSTYNGGNLNNLEQQYYLVGLNLQYRFTPNFSTEVGYNFDDVKSDAGLQPGYDRNRVYVGITGSY